MDFSNKNKGARQGQFQNSKTLRPPNGLHSQATRAQDLPQAAKNLPTGGPFNPNHEIENSLVAKDPKKASTLLDQNNKANALQQTQANDPQKLEFKPRKWRQLQQQLEEEEKLHDLLQEPPGAAAQQEYPKLAGVPGHHLSLNSSIENDIENAGNQQATISKQGNKAMADGGRQSRPSEIINNNEQSYRKSIENMLTLLQGGAQGSQGVGQQNVQSSNDTEQIQKQIDSMMATPNQIMDIGAYNGAGLANLGASSKPTKLDHQLQSHLEGIEHSNEQQRKSLNNLSLSSAKRKSTAMYRTTGEQVGHLMFRKSGFIREHQNQRRSMVANHAEEEEAAADSFDKFDRLDIESYENREAKEYFVNKEQALAREQQIKEVVKGLQEGKIPSHNSSVLERKSMPSSMQDIQINQITEKASAQANQNILPQNAKKATGQELEGAQQQFNLMATISGRAIDYGLDVRMNLSQINNSLTMIYKAAARGQAYEDEYGESCLSGLTRQQIQSTYSTQDARWNFITLLQDELSFERDHIYQELIRKKIVAHQKQKNLQSSAMTAEQRQAAFTAVGYLDRFLIYLIDKILHANFSSFQILIRNIELSLQKPKLGTGDEEGQEQPVKNTEDEQMHKQLNLDIWPIGVVHLRQKTKCLGTAAAHRSSLLARLEAANNQLDTFCGQKNSMSKDQFERWVMEHDSAERHDNSSLLAQIQQQIRLKSKMKLQQVKDMQVKADEEQDQKIKIHRQLFQNLNQGLDSQNPIIKQLLDLENAQFLTLDSQNDGAAPPLLLAIDARKVPGPITERIEQLVGAEDRRQSSKIETLIKQTQRTAKMQQAYRDLAKLHTLQSQSILPSAINLLNEQRKQVRERRTAWLIGGEDQAEAQIQEFKKRVEFMKERIEKPSLADNTLERYSEDVVMQRIDNHCGNKVSERLREIVLKRTYAASRGRLDKLVD